MRIPPPRHPDWLLGLLLLLIIAVVQVAVLHCFCAIGNLKGDIALGVDVELAALMLYHAWRGPRPVWILVHVSVALLAIPVIDAAVGH